MDKTSRRTKLSFLILCVIVVLTGFFGAMVPKIVMDNDLRHFFPEDNPAYTRSNNLTDDFGDQYVFDVVIETDEGIILNKKYLHIIKKISEEFETLDDVVEVKSLTNIEFITNEGTTLLTGKLVPDDWYETGNVHILKEKILEWSKAYKGTVVSDDFKGVQIILTINSDATPEQISTLYYNVIDVIEKNINTEKTLDYKIAGDPVLTEHAKLFMYADLKYLIPLIAIVVLLCLFLSFRNIEGTLLPLFAVLISTVWTAGAMALIGEPLTIVSSCLPVLLIAVGSAYGIHIVNYYYQNLEKKPLIKSKEEHQALVLETLKLAKFPVILAGITTIAGFVSTITSPIKPLKSFAIFSALGITVSLAMAFAFIPSILMIKSVRIIQYQQRAMSKRAVKKNARLAALGINTKDTLLNTVYHAINQRQGVFMGFLLLVLGLSVYGIFNLNIESAFLSYFPKNSRVYQDVDYIDNNYVGTASFSLVIDGKEKGDLCNPEILKQMDDLEIFLKEHHPEIGTILSFTEFIKRMNQVMHAGTSGQTQEAKPADTGSDLGSDDSFFSEDSASDSDDSFFTADSELDSDDSFFTDENEGESSEDSFFTEEEDAGEMPSESDNLAAAAPFFAEYKGKTFTADEAVKLFILAYSEANSSDITVTEFIDSLKRCLNYQGSAYNEIPYDISKYPARTKAELQNIISQYLLLYSGSLETLIDDNLRPKKSRMEVIMRTHDTGIIKRVIEDAKNFAADHFPEGYTITAAGLGDLEVAMTSMIISSQVSSLLLAVIIVFCILAVFYRSFLAGVIGAIPLGLSIVLNFGIMTLTGINLDMVTSLVAAIAIGIGIDYTVHFMNNYHHERLQSRDLMQVTLNTLKHSGKGIAVNAFSVGAGFVVLCFSKFIVLRFIGFLVAVVMFTSSLAALTVLPVILNMINPKFMAKQKKEKETHE